MSASASPNIERTDGSESFTFIGGARVGFLTAGGWPLARMVITRDSITIKIFLIGRFQLAASDVVCVAQSASAWDYSVHVEHRRSDFPRIIRFYPASTADMGWILHRAAQMGFQVSVGASEMPRKSSAVRPGAILIAIAVWSGLVLCDGMCGPGLQGIVVLAALALAMLASVAVLFSRTIQQIVLKPGHGVGEIRPVLLGMVLIFGMTLAIGLALRVIVL